MKIVINSCFGGFGLSTEAMKKLIARGCKAVKSQTVEKYTGGRGWFSDSMTPNKDAGDGYMIGFITDMLVKDGMVYTYEDHERTDPDLIAVVEEIGEAANGQCAELKVIVIPDGVEYEIDEYDGMESVHEKHRSWE